MTDTLVGYKQTEVGIIPNDWNVSSFSEISYMKGRIGWQGLKKEEFNMNSSLPFLITGMNFKDGKIRWKEVYHVSWERFEIAKEIQLKKDDVLMTKDGTIGKVLYVDDIPYPHKASLNSHLLLYRPLRNSYFPKFLYYQLDSFLFKKFIESNKSGSTLTGISQGEVGKYLVILPSIPEQEKIAKTLSDMDELISNLDDLIQKKKNIKIGTMQKLLSPKEGWLEKQFDEIISNFSTGLNPRDNFVLNTGGNNYYVTIKNFRDGKLYLDENCDKIDDIAMEKINKRSNLKKGDLLFSSIGRVGDAYVIKEDPKNRNINESVFSLTPNKKLITSDYLYYLIKSERVHNALTGNTTGSTLTSIKMNHLKKITCSIPPTLEEQQTMATILSDMDKDIEALEEKKAKYEQIKQGTMQQLLTGKIRLG